ncbi:MAG: PDDEXK nuclease domain-containing protein [Lacibacter sp.]
MTDKSVSSYHQIVEALKEKIRFRRMNAVLTANIQMLALYWEIGNTIKEQESSKGWGAKVVEQLARDLRAEFPDFKGLSARNLRYMRDFSIAWPELSMLQQPVATNVHSSILQQPVAKLPWGHNCLILDKLKLREERLFYAEKTLENNWSRNVLAHQIELKLFQRKGMLLNNFSHTLPAAHSDLAMELFKDPYKFDFFQLSEDAHERDLENALVAHMSHFLLEMGKGFAYVGRQVYFEQGGKDYYIDLLLYHLKLHCFVVLELKVGDFKPEYTGKMSFYLSMIDDKLKTDEDKPSIGLILCKNKNNVTVEYALRSIHKPIGVADYEVNFTKAIPENLKADLPTIEALELELKKEVEINQRPIDGKIENLKAIVADLGKAEMQEVKEDRLLFELFSVTIISIIDRLNLILRDIFPMFQESWICPMINGEEERHNAARNFQHYLKQPLGISSVGIFASFQGFKLGGINTFSAEYRLLIDLDKFKYSIGPVNPRKEIWMEKLYGESWTDTELDTLSERWAEWIIDGIKEDVANTK